MLKFLTDNFPEGNHYLVEEKAQNDIDKFFIERLFKPSQTGHKHNLWGEAARQIPDVGRRVGWVPDHFPLIFFSDTVEQEIANAMVSSENKLNGGKTEIDKARLLLERLGIANLMERNPFFLSEGETKLVWFLCQWAKSPDYLLISYLPASLSQQKTDRVLEFLLNSDSLAESLNFGAPTFILGVTAEDVHWYESLLSNENWRFTKDFLPLNSG